MEELIPLEIALLWFLRMKNEGSWKKLFGVMGGSYSLQYSSGGVQYGNPPTLGKTGKNNQGESIIDRVRHYIALGNDVTLPIPAILNKIFHLHIPGF